VGEENGAEVKLDRTEISMIGWICWKKERSVGVGNS